MLNAEPSEQIHSWCSIIFNKQATKVTLQNRYVDRVIFHIQSCLLSPIMHPTPQTPSPRDRQRRWQLRIVARKGNSGWHCQIGMTEDWRGCISKTERLNGSFTPISSMDCGEGEFEVIASISFCGVEIKNELTELETETDELRKKEDIDNTGYWSSTISDVINRLCISLQQRGH